MNKESAHDLDHKNHHKVMPLDRFILLILIVVIVGVATAVFLTYKLVNVTDEAENLTHELNQLNVNLLNTQNNLEQASTTIAALKNQLDLTEEELAELEDDYRREKKKNDDFEDQIDKIAGTVGTLDKLSKTDKELLQKYSRVYFLNENFIPSDIDKINSRYILDGKSDQYFHGDALEFLEDMLDEAKDDGIEIKVISAYRSFDHQHELKGQYTQTYGEGSNTFSADQGYSEHQLGTTVDLTDPNTGGTYGSFENTEAYKWLLDNAYKFGFVLSYPENNKFYIFEPWHWRFVGVDLARDLRKDNAHFYDWEQREIDKYLIKIFD
ncbi:M15 family metallopeptidase [Candidatus Kaiserbacteria bacterium]|nr:M15 family metallopeptidase [Candidatus Kaiserbacteria bacterium]